MLRLEESWDEGWEPVEGVCGRTRASRKEKAGV